MTKRIKKKVDGSKASKLHGGRAILYHCDCLKYMQTLGDNSIDTCITDPPYGLSKPPNIEEVLTRWINGDDYEHRGGGFMGKTWDSFVPGPAVWREVYRVLKPGGYALVFGGTRTYDLLCISLRLAGFRIVDQLAWVHSSGFPKSHDISKAIDKAAGAERSKVAATGGLHKNANLNDDGWSKIGTDDAVMDSDEAVTDAARQWRGWGTALKPAHEPIAVVMKPTDGTYVNNALEHGVAGFNVDGSRIPTTGRPKISGDYKSTDNNAYQGRMDGTLQGGPKNEGTTDEGRWPANLIHDGSDEVLAVFPDGAKPKPGRTGKVGGSGFGYFDDAKTASIDGTWPADPGGSAARFFYCAKASKAERTEGGEVTNSHPTVKPLALMRYLCRLTKTPHGGIVLDPFMGTGTTVKAALLEGRSAVGRESDTESDTFEVAKARVNRTKPKDE